MLIKQSHVGYHMYLCTSFVVLMIVSTIAAMIYETEEPSQPFLKKNSSLNKGWWYSTNKLNWDLAILYLLSSTYCHLSQKWNNKDLTVPEIITGTDKIGFGSMHQAHGSSIFFTDYSCKTDCPVQHLVVFCCGLLFVFFFFSRERP